MIGDYPAYELRPIVIAFPNSLHLLIEGYHVIMECNHSRMELCLLDLWHVLHVHLPMRIGHFIQSHMV
jgi:hypothetical protein